jgi:AraC-like DNA-binding protein
MAIGWMEIIALYVLIQLLFLTIVTFNYKKGKRLSNRILSGFMASNALLIGHYLLSHFQLISGAKNPFLFAVGASSYVLLMPLLFLYLQSLCYKDFRLRILHALHAIPFVVSVSLWLYANFLRQEVLQPGAPSPWQQLVATAEYWGHHGIRHLQILSYLIASIVLLAKYRRHLKDMYSSIERIDLAWCNLLLVGFAGMWSLDFLNWILRSFWAVSGPLIYWLFLSSLCINLAFTLVVAYKGFAQSASFSGIKVPDKYASSRLKQTECEVIVRKLNKSMKQEKLYLEPSLSVEDLAKKLSISVKHLSQAIHVGLNQNFYDYINSHRIEEATQLLRDDRYQNRTFLAVAYDVGFNSKSVFNAAFKKHTGKTPREFKQRSFARPLSLTVRS